MSEEMHGEFGTVAAWTAQVAVELDAAHRLAAACRGSGGPAALRWLLSSLHPHPNDILVDSGAGLGGPAEYARQHAKVCALPIEPERDALRGARTLFGLTGAQGSAEQLPVADDSADLGWSIAVLCTVADKLAALRELRRVVRPGGRAALLVYCRTVVDLADPPEGNLFPTTPELLDLVGATGWDVVEQVSMTSLDVPDATWRGLEAEVDQRLEARYGHEPVWQSARRQSDAFGRLLDDGSLEGRLLALRRPRRLTGRPTP